MSQWMSATFLGTSSGGGPSESRNCSSLVLDVVGDNSLWMIDGAEGTLRQFSLQPEGGRSIRVQVGKVNKIFITHMHPDHIMGLPTLLRNILGFPHPEALSPRGTPPKINLYGPAGLRTFLRTTLSLTRTKTADRYAVHELLAPTDPHTPCDVEALHHNEEPGQDVLCDEEGFWRDFAEGRSMRGSVNVCAGPLVHRDPCIGYIIHEPATLAAPRKLAILGDTSDASQLTPLVRSTPGRLSLLVHEATDAHMPAEIDARIAAKRPPALVASSAQERGHSTPTQAGACAGQWGARQLVLNHIGTRFPAPSIGSRSGKRVAIMREIERQATEAWLATPCDVFATGESVAVAEAAEVRRAVAAHDFMVVRIPLLAQTDDQGHECRRQCRTGAWSPREAEKEGLHGSRRRQLVAEVMSFSVLFTSLVIKGVLEAV
ncbi:beta-lactamase-like protein [Lactarius pseudohatsudake]|nr:beta-lactamase-like protein [Lactarius pseudohatsudake]